MQIIAELLNAVFLVLLIAVADVVILLGVYSVLRLLRLSTHWAIRFIGTILLITSGIIGILFFMHLIRI